ncbi:MAG: ABC transporter ATP-binding protein [Bacteroides sp.]|nr:ABC transporter ATP-binding protein [Roseburia sp.]MCM1345591.1 ABC transporter ATP-binding protein [Bacteroides sp.]MCM1421925.1 ABC transporter ATP-binding protein [Bacteroides sp.]
MNLTIENIKKTFGEKVAVDIDRYFIHSGEIVGLLGNNGAGKTTLFRIILDLLLPDCGTATIGGTLPSCDGAGGDADTQSRSGEQVAFVTSECEDWKAFTGAYIDNGFLIDYLTPDEYFAFVGKVNGMTKEQIGARLTRFENFMNGEVMGNNTLIRNLSAGNKQKVGIIGAMLNNPRLLILDEPFNFLDPSSQIAMKYMLESYNHETGATVLVSSHNLTHTFDICTRITLLEHGRILKDYDKNYADLTSEIEDYFKGNVHN